jgi:radical SAM protein
MNHVSGKIDYHHAPFIVIWEVTRACDLACSHCRAEAQPLVDPDELTHAEGIALLDHIKLEFGDPVLVFTGGDPLKRADLRELIRYGTDIGLRIALTPSATPLLTRAAIRDLRAAGLVRMAVSVDGADAESHDRFRGVKGTFERSMDALRYARELGMETQINTSIWRGNRHQLTALAELAEGLGVSLWSVFLLVPTGRADAALLMSADEHEEVYQALVDLAGREKRPMAIKTTAGQPFYRALAQRGMRRTGSKPGSGAPIGAGMRSQQPVNDGNGFVFISHTGQVCPSGFLPLVCGNIREKPLATIYREHPQFIALRDPDRLGGKCGVCEFRRMCGGSRSRSYG